MIISFSAWPELVAEIERRSPTNEKPHSIARRDLVRYYACIAATLAEVLAKVPPADLETMCGRLESSTGCAALTGIDSRDVLPESVRNLSEWEYVVLIDHCETRNLV